MTTATAAGAVNGSGGGGGANKNSNDLNKKIAQLEEALMGKDLMIRSLRDQVVTVAAASPKRHGSGRVSVSSAFRSIGRKASSDDESVVSAASRDSSVERGGPPSGAMPPLVPTPSKQPKRNRSFGALVGGWSNTSKNEDGPENTMVMSKWDKAVRVLDKLLEPEAPTCIVMTPKQRQEVGAVKTLLLKGVEGENRLKHYVPTQLMGKSGSHRESASPQKEPTGILSKMADTTSRFIMREFGGVSSSSSRRKQDWAVKTSFTTRSQQDPEQPLQQIEVQEEAYILPEFQLLSRQNQKKLFSMLSWTPLKNWGFNVFELNELSGGHPLLFMGWAIIGSPHSQFAMAQACGLSDVRMMDLKGYGFVSSEQLKIPQDTLCNYLRQMEKDYVAENPYHNEVHAADVLQTLHSFIQMKPDSLTFTEMELLCILLAAAIHDVDHPGENNTFQINCRTNLALLYNDQAVLENHHVSHAFKRMLGLDQEETTKPHIAGSRRPSFINLGHTTELNILLNLTHEQLNTARTMTIEAVLHTDMTKHFSMVSSMKGLLLSTNFRKGGACLEKTEDNDPDDGFGWKILLYLLHVADISNPAKPDPLFKMWTDRCLTEFFEQGEREEALGLPISPNCDGKTTCVPSCQVGFINFVVKPSIDVLATAFPRVEQQVSTQLESNLEYWVDEKRKATILKEIANQGTTPDK